MFYYWLADIIHTLNTVAFMSTTLFSMTIVVTIITIFNSMDYNDMYKIVCICTLVVFCICLPLLILLPSSNTAWQIAKHLNQGT